MHRKSAVKASLILWFHPSKQVLIESHISYNLLNTRLDFEETTSKTETETYTLYALATTTTNSNKNDWYAANYLIW